MREVPGSNLIGDIAFFGGKTCSTVLHMYNVETTSVYYYYIHKRFHLDLIFFITEIFLTING